MNLAVIRQRRENSHIVHHAARVSRRQPPRSCLLRELLHFYSVTSHGITFRHFKVPLYLRAAKERKEKRSLRGCKFSERQSEFFRSRHTVELSIDNPRLKRGRPRDPIIELTKDSAKQRNPARTFGWTCGVAMTTVELINP